METEEPKDVLCISLLDWFAGMALKGLLAFPGEYQYEPDEAAERSYIFAQAMMEEREKINAKRKRDREAERRG